MQRNRILFLLTVTGFMLPHAAAEPAQTVKNRQPLAANAFYRLPLTSVRPSGWLKQQLVIQAQGLSGHLDEFWPDLGENSAWLGGSGEGWERGPYFLDGLVPLAYLLNDPHLMQKVNRWIAWTLDHQRADGSIGPGKNKDWWPNMVMLKALTQYQEATQDNRVIPLLEKYFAYQAAHIDERPLFEWAKFRWHDEIVSILWLYNRTGNPKLLDLARKLQQQGYDWKSQFANFTFKQKVTREQIHLRTHVVNNAMALKTYGEWFLISGDPADKQAVYRQLAEMDRYHLLSNGLYSGDEHYAGKNPSQGTELCAVVEEMFSFEELTSIFGDPGFGDRIEKIAYNALPATFDADMWAHQYDQQANQVLVDIQPRQWTNNGSDSNLFGLEPNFGCCTSNFHQGWPKFAASLWMQSADDGLAAVFYAPSEVKVTLRGVPVSVTEVTNYPFQETIKLTVSPAKKVNFPLQLRIPAWAANAAVFVNGKRQSGIKAGTFFRIARTWKANDQVEIQFPMAVRASRWFNNSVVLERGPLVFSLKIGEDWRKIKQNSQGADWAVYPTTPWNYGLVLDPHHPQNSVKVVEKPIFGKPFSSVGAPLELQVKARKIPAWQLESGSAGTLPRSPARSSEPFETITLIPYGSAKLRITEFPLLQN